MKIFLVLILGIFLSACTSLSASSLTCKKWRLQGDFYSTIDSCRKCVDSMGSEDKQAVQGCALGLDASTLLSGMK